MTSQQPHHQAQDHDDSQSDSDLSYASVLSDSDMASLPPVHVRWGMMFIPEVVDANGEVTQWQNAAVENVEPWISPDDPGVKGGSGILDTTPATLQYIRFTKPQDSPRKDRDLEEKRRWYLVNNIDDLSANDSEEDVNYADRTTRARFREQDNNKPAERLGSPPFLRCSSGVEGRVPLQPENATNSMPTTMFSSPTSIMSNTIALASTSSLSSSIPSSSTPSDAAFNLDDMWHDLQIQMIGGSASWHDMLGEHTPVFCPEETSLSMPFGELDLGDLLDSKEDDDYEEPGSFELTIKCGQDGIVLFQPPHTILVKLSATSKMVARPFSVASTMQTCWEIVRDHRVTNVKASLPPSILTTRDLAPPSSFDINWVRRNAGIYLDQIGRPLPTYHYLNIQDQSRNNPLSVDAATVSYISHFRAQLMTLMTYHYIFRFPLAPILPDSQTEVLADGEFQNTAEHNLSISQFIKRIYVDGKRAERERMGDWKDKHPGQDYVEVGHVVPDEAAYVDEWPREEHIECPPDWDHLGMTAGVPGVTNSGYFDLQQIDWQKKVGMRREEARAFRDRTYVKPVNILNIAHGGRPDGMDHDALPDTLNAVNFVPHARHSTHHPTFPHFQLRNLIAARTHLQLLYADGLRGKVYTTVPYNSTRQCVIDLSTPSNTTLYTEPVRISTLTLSTDRRRSVCVVGGMGGELAIRNLDSEPIATDVEAEQQVRLVTTHNENGMGIVNHVDLDYWACRGRFEAVVACNDRRIRTYDVQTGVWMHAGDGKKTADGTKTGWVYPWAVNCTAACPDGKLRVIVGDTPDVTIISTSTGRCERLLKGHADWGFACAWSPDSLYVATANQDKLVNIYDARTWRILSTFESHVSGYKSMKFSPVGGGTRALLLAEPEGRVCVVNAMGFVESQTHEFFGEIAGIDWCGDGSGFWVGNADDQFGGFMEFERRGYGERRGLGFQRRREIEEMGDEYFEDGPEEWIEEKERWRDGRCVDPGRKGRSGNWWWMQGVGNGWAYD